MKVSRISQSIGQETAEKKDIFMRQICIFKKYLLTYLKKSVETTGFFDFVDKEDIEGIKRFIKKGLKLICVAGA